MEYFFFSQVIKKRKSEFLQAWNTEAFAFHVPVPPAFNLHATDSAHCANLEDLATIFQGRRRGEWEKCGVEN